MPTTNQNQNQSKTQTTNSATDTDHEDDPDDATRTVDNPQRGCGYLKPGTCYIRGPDGEDHSGDPSQGGGKDNLPAFVRFDPPVPYYEDMGSGNSGHSRGYTYFAGVQFELATTAGDDPIATTDPAGELDRHLDRLRRYQPYGDHVGEMESAFAHDVMMHVGKSYYPDPEEFIQECEDHGLSKAIPVSKNQEPPVINFGLTRCFLVHPRAIYVGEDEDGEDVYDPGIIGYAYLTDCVFTATQSGEYPRWVRDRADAGYFDLVAIGQRVPRSAQQNQSLDEYDDATEEAVATDGGDVDADQ